MNDILRLTIVMIIATAFVACQKAPLKQNYSDSFFNQESEKVLNRVAANIEAGRTKYRGIRSHSRGLSPVGPTESSYSWTFDPNDPDSFPPPTAEGEYDFDIAYDTLDCTDTVYFMQMEPRTFSDVMGVLAQCLDSHLVQQGMALAKTFADMSQQSQLNLLFLTDWRGDGKRKKKSKDEAFSSSNVDRLFGGAFQGGLSPILLPKTLGGAI